MSSFLKVSDISINWAIENKIFYINYTVPLYLLLGDEFTVEIFMINDSGNDMIADFNSIQYHSSLHLAASTDTSPVIIESKGIESRNRTFRAIDRAEEAFIYVEMTATDPNNVQYKATYNRTMNIS